MDAMLQRHCARYIYVVPNGLRELMSDISREVTNLIKSSSVSSSLLPIQVLRSQPEDIYTFIADYLDALMITRENARVSAKFVQYMTDAAETLIDLLSSSGMSKAEANHAAEVIQEAFRTWSSRKGILKEDEETIVARIIEDTGISELQAQEAAICIQNAFRAFKMRQEREQEFLTGVVDWRVAARSAIKLYRKTGVSPEEAKRAANLIKAAYKGYYTRRTLQQLNEVNAAIEEEEPAMMGDDMSMASGFSDRKKEVRIDYQTVVPHVDFGDEELISRELTTIMDDELGGMDDDQDVMDKIFGSGRKKESTTEDFVKELLEEYVLK
ncbi:hypothetical protein BDFB_007668 [Asbolus verrucosus]|uniref:Uncharacterized protein n=1 Tax=Asbolus verrucosus TaxID=1661398 RepID=A0A482VND1_ASBVE|nr:hypothetical protein BDFB_007668 [Asbolus verrucosus]